MRGCGAGFVRVVWEKVAARPGVGSVQSIREGYNGLIRRGGQYYLPAAPASTESAAVYMYSVPIRVTESAAKFQTPSAVEFQSDDPAGCAVLCCAAT